MNNTQKSEKLRKFFKDRPALSAQGVEKESGIPDQAIAWVKKGRELPEQHWESLIPVLKKYGWK